MVDITQRFTPDFAQATADNSYYALTMFPYPSGAGLHAGHASVFTINDVTARFKRMQGNVVFNPFGFDSFGLPTENYAMQQGRPAYEVTEENKAHYLRQVQALNFSFDYERLVTTSQADYYKRTQWIFAKLYEAGLAYRDELWVNRCPDCQTVLANDQVVDGKCERCKNDIIQKKMPQWFIKITDYADRLIADLDLIDRPEETKTAQKNWIGRSEGAEIVFEVINEGTKKTRHSEGRTTEESGGSIQDSSLRSEGQIQTIKCFTTRPDTIFGVTAVVLAPENTDLDHLLTPEKKTEVEEYRQQTLAKTSVQRQQDAKDKTGVESGVFVEHPLTGENISVWYADYVLADYGSGAVMMVPAHDERDFEFAKKYGIEVRQVIAPKIFCGGDLTPRSDVETIKRNVIDVVIENNEGKFLLMNDTHRHLVGGGIEKGDTVEETVYKEIKEETGYINIKIESIFLSDFYAMGYRETKNVNQDVHSTIFHVKVLNEEKVFCEVDEGKHNIAWFSKDEIANKIERKHHKLMWEIFESGTYTGKDGVLVNSGQFNGLDHTTAKTKITEHLESLEKGERKITYRLRDRSVSRQRYWGSPIPVYYAPKENPKVPFQKYTSGIWTFKEDEKVMSRKTIAGILKDPATGKYAIIKRLGLEEENYTLVLGGVDEGETGEQAAWREIHEETGYKNIKLIKKLGDFQTEFWHAVKKRNQHNITQCYLFELIDHENDGGAQEENENLEVVWMSKEELPVSKYDMFRDHFLDLAEGKEVTRQGEWIEKYNEYNIAPIEVCETKLIPDSELPVHLPLDIENYKPKGKSPLEEHPTFPWYTPKNSSSNFSIQADNSITYTYDKKSKRYPQEDVETKSRENVMIIIKNPEGEYLLCNHSDGGVISFPGGGIEKGESVEDAVRRECIEETGYTNIGMIKELGTPIHSTFYHWSKKVNMNEKCYIYLVELEDGKKQKVSDEEQSKHTMVWTQKDSINGLLTSEYLQFIWNRVVGGTDESFIDKKPTILLIHGRGNTPGNAGALDGIAEALKEEDVNVIFPSLDYHKTFDYESTMELLLQYGADIVVGHSSGGYLAQHYANAKSVQNIVLIAPTCDAVCMDEDEKVVPVWDAEFIGMVEERLGKDEAKKYIAFHSNPTLFDTITEANIHVFFGENDTVIPDCIRAWYATNDITVLPGREHMGSLESTNSIPEINNYLSSMLSTLSSPTTYLRECDTLDTFMCSSFYFLRYPNVGDDTQLINKALADKLFPIDLYTGGKEHTVGHLLYSRFIHKFLYDQGYVSSPEPFGKLVHQGMVLGNDGRKMGKRYGNGVDPLEIVEEFGADAVRTYLMFMGPVEQDKIWNQNALNGVKKFLARVERLIPKTGMDMRVSDDYLMQSPDVQESAQQAVISMYHQTIIDITGDFEKLKYNTAVSKIMILVNTIYEHGIAPHEVLLGLTKFIVLFATELGDRMRAALGRTDDVQFGNRPVADESKIVLTSITLPIQINGKVRANSEIAPGTSEEEVMKLAKEQENVQKYLEGKTVRKVIYIQDKILNIVVG